MTRINRRRALALGGGAALAALLPGAARCQPVAENDDRLDPGYIVAELDTRRTLHGYLVRPRADARRLPGVVVVHDDAGLTVATRAVARRLALEGHVAFAPDMVAGGTPADAGAARAAIARLAPPPVLADAAAAVRWLAGERRTTGAVAILGFGWGGTVTNGVAAAARQTARAGVAYYGDVPDVGEVRGGAAPLLEHFAGQDEAVNRRGERWVRALQRAGGEVTAFYYPTARHGFAEPGPAFDEAAEGLAWERTIAFLRRQLA